MVTTRTPLGRRAMRDHKPHTLSYALKPQNHSLNHSLIHSLTHALARLLTHSRTRSQLTSKLRAKPNKDDTDLMDDGRLPTCFTTLELRSTPVDFEASSNEKRTKRVGSLSYKKVAGASFMGDAREHRSMPHMLHEGTMYVAEELMSSHMMMSSPPTAFLIAPLVKSVLEQLLGSLSTASAAFPKPECDADVNVSCVDLVTPLTLTWQIDRRSSVVRIVTAIFE